MARRVGLVLAGGRGRRLGNRDKGSLVRSGQTFAARAAGVLQDLCDGVLISVRAGDDDPAPGRPVLVDPPPAGRGPLAGIDAAFEATHDADLLVLACDYPFVDAALLRQIVTRCGHSDDLVLVTDYAGRDHPLVALWRRSAATAVRAAVADSRLKVRALFSELVVRRLDPNDLPGIDLDRALRNVNEPDDLVDLADS